MNPPPEVGFLLSMCGIAGIYRFQGATPDDLEKVQRAVALMDHRGPDHQAVQKCGENAVLGHARLKVIDTSDEANQPMASNGSCIVYNGEVYNYQELQHQFNLTTQTSSDTEVLLKTLLLGQEHVRHFNGCFAIGLIQNNRLTLIRDRYGIKPLYWHRNEAYVAFASELEAIQELVNGVTIDRSSVAIYQQLTYIPGSHSPLNEIEKVPPGGIIEVNPDEIVQASWYQPAKKATSSPVDDLRKALEDAVHDRLISDVPLGTFLSGGTDSSLISAIAKQNKNNLHTFSISYPDHPHYDEGAYAKKVAKHIGSEHHEIAMGNDELAQSALEVLEGLSEPFADSSAIAMNWLCKQTRNHVTVALSGDGADELFAGYNKHLAMQQITKGGWKDTAIKGLASITNAGSGNRDSKSANLVRKAHRYKEAAGLSESDRYWFLATFMPESEALELVIHDHDHYASVKRALLQGDVSSLNGILQQDQSMVLQGDMLRKADLCSMLHGLEVRVPFMDHRVVEIANGLPAVYKIDDKLRQKAILKEAFGNVLSPEIFERSKHGFEVPLRALLEGPLHSKVFDQLLSSDAVEASGVYNHVKLSELMDRFHASRSSEDSSAIWTIACFQSWYLRTFAHA